MLTVVHHRQQGEHSAAATLPLSTVLLQTGGETLQTVTHMCHCGHHKTHPSAASLHEHNANGPSSLRKLRMCY